MDSTNTSVSLAKLRVRVGKTVRELRQGRRWTQAELSQQIGISQGHLSEIEGGKGSFTAEQFLLILRLFNVGANQFAPTSTDPEADLQNALARMGATHLQESVEVVPSEVLDNVEHAIREGLTSASPRLIAALAPVVVRHVDRINFRKLRADLASVGFERRLEWLFENIRDALHEELGRSPPPAWAKRYRRASVVLETALDFVPPHLRVAEIPPPDVLDLGIRSKQTLHEVRAASSSISRRWGIVSRLRPEQFAAALKAARETD